MLFILQAGPPSAPIKIEYAHNDARMRARVRALQPGNPSPLRTLAIITQAGVGAERALREALAHYHLGYGWYSYESPLRRLVADAETQPCLDVQSWVRDYAVRRERWRQSAPGRRARARAARRASVGRAIEDGSLSIRYESAGNDA